MTEKRTIAELIKAAGGAQRIVEEAKSNGRLLTIWAVYKWRGAGIPSWHWGIFTSLADATTDELFAANMAARDGK